MQNQNGGECGVHTPLNILLVEDDRVNQIITSRVLSNAGLCVVVANHGAEALHLIRQKKFALVLMDIQMPVMDGYETAIQIRSLNDPYFRSIPILAYTSCSLESTKQRVEQCGMNGIINKSFDAVEMHSKINHYIKIGI